MNEKFEDDAKGKKIQMAMSTEVKARPVIFAGPFPPPTHGQSLCTKVLADRLSDAGVSIQRVNLNASGGNGGIRLITKTWRHIRLVAASRRTSAVYISANSNAGMWITAGAAALLRLMRKRLFIHHHAFDHVRRRRPSMVALARAAGPQAIHIVLGQNMSEQLRMNTPEVKHTLVLNNAGLVDSTLEQHLGHPDGIWLGHLSNLSKDKGIVEVVALATHLHTIGVPVHLLVAGPTTDKDAEEAIQMAGKQLGDRFEYLGPVSGQRKTDFFTRISHFVFPTHYRNEASPMVLLEAMAAGVPCISTDIGCIPNDIGKDGGLVIPLADDFEAAATAYLTTASTDAPAAARAQFQRLRSAHDDQLHALVGLLQGVDGSVTPARQPQTV